MNTVITCK